MKNWRKIISLLLFSSGYLAAIPVTCHPLLEKSAQAKDDGYEYVSVLGSDLPRRVKKGEAPATDSSIDSMSASDFQKLRQRMQIPTLPGQ